MQSQMTVYDLRLIGEIQNLAAFFWINFIKKKKILRKSSFDLSFNFGNGLFV